MLEVNNIHKTFNGNPLLKGIDFHIEKGEVVAILGPSGSGKTTFLRCLNLLERAEQGTLRFTDGSLFLFCQENQQSGRTVIASSLIYGVSAIQFVPSSHRT